MNLQESKVISIKEMQDKAVRLDFELQLSEFELDVMVGLYFGGWDREKVIAECQKQEGLTISDDTLEAFDRTIFR